MSVSEDPPEASASLTIEQQQVLAFVGSYLRHYGCLPTATETALACGFRSPRPAARLVNELESFGLVHRDEQYGRLGSIEAPKLTVDEPHQLWLVARDSLEHRSFLVALRIGLRFAPDFDVINAIHNEGVTRSTVLRTFDDARQRLLEGGSLLTAAGTAELERQQRVLDRAVALMTDWNAYCIVQLVWSLSAQEAFAHFKPLHLGYMGASLVAARRALDALVPLYWARAALALETDPRVPQLLDRIGALLGDLRAGVHEHFPMPAYLQRVDVSALLAS
jgi:hypothetical protein